MQSTLKDFGPELIRLVRQALELHFGKRGSCPISDDLENLPSRGVFVTLREATGELRGCIGHIEPVHDRLIDEIRDCAILAASEDPRFSPVMAAELPFLELELSILTPPERIASRTELDPRVWGVVVSSKGRRGVLLPDINGVDTVEKQLSIALKKAWISEKEEYEIDRFSVEKFVE